MRKQHQWVTDSAHNNHNKAMLHHDIRSAIADVMAGLRLAQMEVLPPSVQERLEGVQASSEHLARLVTALLTEEADKPVKTVYPKNADLYRLLQELRKRWMLHAGGMNAELRFVISDALPPLVQVDRLELERILDNLLSNAFKHAGHAQAKAEVFFEAKYDCGEIRFFVADNGKGFSKDARDLLFELWGRPSNHEVPGSGVGLHFCAQAIT